MIPSLAFAKTEVPLANPFAMLAKCANTLGDHDFSAFFLSRLKEKPPSPEQPWSLILYSDEVTPGNVLAVRNDRKFHGIYFSFIELGVNALSREESWFVLVVEFSNTVNELSAGISQVFSKCIRYFFQADGFNLATAGMMLDFPGESVRFWAKLTNVLIVFQGWC